MTCVNLRSSLRACACTALILFFLYAGERGAEARRRGRKSSRSKKNSEDEAITTHFIFARLARLNNTNPMLWNHRPSTIRSNQARKHKSKAAEWTEAVISLHSHSRRYNSAKHRTIGKFGYHSEQKNVVGRLVHVQDPGLNSNLGCAGGVANKHEIPKDEPWIALIRRGKCYFFNKIKLAELNNASAVVIYDNKRGRPQVMNTAGTNVVALMVNQRFGERVVELLDAGTQLYMNITVGERRNASEKDTPPAAPPTAAPRSETTNAAHRPDLNLLRGLIVSMLTIMMSSSLFVSNR